MLLFLWYNYELNDIIIKGDIMRVGIIGGGASGLVCAIKASINNDVTIYEKNNSSFVDSGSDGVMLRVCRYDRHADCGFAECY